MLTNVHIYKTIVTSYNEKLNTPSPGRYLGNLIDKILKMAG